MPKRSPTKKQNLTKIEPIEPIEPVIQVIRGQRILDSNLAEIYDVTTKRLNEHENATSKGFQMISCFV